MMVLLEFMGSESILDLFYAENVFKKKSKTKRKTNVEQFQNGHF